jgi:hypothetical protein
MKAMLNDMTRSRLIQAWFVAVVLAVVAGVALGVSVSRSTAAMLLALSLAPPAILLLLWPGIQSPTAGDVIRGPDRRD